MSLTKPLSPIELSILIAIGSGELHGYEIMKEIALVSGGRNKVGPGTLYVAIKRLLNDDLISEAKDKRSSRRRYYCLTPNGKKAVTAEIAAYQETLKWAASQGLSASL